MITSPLCFAPVFSDHAVLQRDIFIPIWGTAAPSAVVTVRLADRVGRVIASPEGRWLVRLPALPAGGPHELAASTDSGEARSIADVLIGDVWICAGQSNMEWELSQTAQGLSESESRLPGIRLLTVKTPARLGPQMEIDGRWTAATQETLGKFSAVGAWFGLTLHRELGVPVGLVCIAWGGTRLQAWMSREALVLDPDGLDEVSAYEKTAYAIPEPGVTPTPADWQRESLLLDACNLGLERGWASPSFDDRLWKKMTLPARWQDHGHAENGVFWFRRQVTLPASWHGRDLVLHLGAIDKHDDTYVGGERVGGLSWSAGDNAWCTPRVYRVPAGLVRGEVLQIAVRARSHCFHGGLTGPGSAMQLIVAGDVMSGVTLAGEWRYEREQDWGVRIPPDARIAPGSPNSPFTLFDSRLAPLVPYAMRGVIWYQGESNVSEAARYRRLFPQMVRDWRRAFGQGAFPFIQVQLANYMPPSVQPGPSVWAELREAQAAAMSEPGVGMAVAIDIGEAGDIHPRNKRSVGERLARWALSEAYGQPGDSCGPLFAGLTKEGGRLRVAFTRAGGLRTNDGLPPRQVAIAGEARVFVWAEARIEGETLVAWSEHVPTPVAVRYAWADNPEGCNLIGGSASLPAAPFRSDSW
ncbi:MAG TPA: sialate O-acetylesterase [Rariglobus sp.]|nr:sialate O-acetylesterase [Rariglobus sp.]